MRTRTCVAAIGATVGLLVTAPTAAMAQDVTQCVEWSPRGYCIEWDVPTPGTPGYAWRLGRRPASRVLLGQPRIRHRGPNDLRRLRTGPPAGRR